MKGWLFGIYYPLDFNRPSGRLMHRQLVEHDIRTLDDLPVLRVLESVSDLAIWFVAKENAFLGSRFEFSAIVFSV